MSIIYLFNQLPGWGKVNKRIYARVQNKINEWLNEWMNDLTD